MSAAAPLQPKKDKYAELLAKYDWRSPVPPRGYQFGVGRGARAFTTSAELSSTTIAIDKKSNNRNGAFTSLMTAAPETSDLLDALDRLEERRHKRRREGPGSINSGALRERMKTSRPILSMEDLATVGCGAGQSLVRREARTEAMDVVDGHAFGDDTSVVTAADLLRSQTRAAAEGLETILGMGSPTEQTTWITHARAFREMGMTRKAQQALIDGCRMAGDKGPFIWKERLEYTRDSAAQRQLLEEAVRSCSGCEELWLLLLEHEPPHEQPHWLQQAVMACPSSEGLWLRILTHIPTPRDQKKIIRKALEVTPQLPSLWAMLARLESYETGKAIFNAAAAEHPSLNIIVEAAKFEEFHQNSRVKEEENTEGRSFHELGNERIQSFVRKAAERFLVVDEEKSRKEWLEAARTAALDRYVLTSAYMYLYFVSDKRTASLSVPSTWIEDLVALLPDTWRTHESLCAIWMTMLILHKTHGCPSHATGGAAAAALTEKEMEVIACSLQLAPSSVVDATLSELEKRLPWTTVTTTTNDASRSVKKEEEEVKVKKEDEEEELAELGRPATTQMTSSSLLLQNGSATSATAASHSLPLPLTCVFTETLFHMPLLTSVEVILRVAKVLFDRGFYEGASHVLRLGITRHPSSTALFAATAKALLAVGREPDAVQVLNQGIELDPADTDIVWIKLIVHQRSKHEEILSLLDRAIHVFPKSEKLWLMRLEAEGVRIKRLLDDAAMRGVSTAPFITELRQIYSKALSLAHCRHSSTLWCYTALRLESSLLSNASIARALLLEGVVVCSQYQPNRRAEIHAAFGLARSHVELMHAGRETALEVVRETLQQLPKKNGGFTVPVGELVALSIDLESPALRGRAAAQAVQHWRVRDPLVISAVAKIYHAAGKYDKALEQALKAVRMSEGRCGDSVALWLKLASLHAYKAVAGGLVGITDEVVLSNTEESIPMKLLLSWLCNQVESDNNDAVDDCNNNNNNSNEEDVKKECTLKPNYGPLWIYVAKVRDPSNVTLLGYRDSIETMLQQVMNLIEL